MDVERGDLFGGDDVRQAARVGLLGRTLAMDVYGSTSAVRQRLFINHVPLEVVGMLGERGQGLEL